MVFIANLLNLYVNVFFGTEYRQQKNVGVPLRIDVINTFH